MRYVELEATYDKGLHVLVDKWGIAPKSWGLGWATLDEMDSWGYELITIIKIQVEGKEFMAILKDTRTNGTRT